MQTPGLWQTKNICSAFLMPFGFVYGLATFLRLKFVKPVKVGVPVICIGNLTAGGTGKTPVAMFVAELIKAHGKNPFFISRGYGGKLQNVLVNPQIHTARDVGDEPLLLSQIAPTVVCKDRVRAAKTAISYGADCLIMDDGFQNPWLYKDFSVLVFNGKYGVGNGRLIPSGPLRETLSNGLKRADCAIVMEGDTSGITKKLNLPTFSGKIVQLPVKNCAQKVLAFAGIGHPQKFYDSLMKSGLTIARIHNFPDHHFYTRPELDALIFEAEENNLALFTTAKDFVKIPTDLQTKFNVLQIKAKLENPKAFFTLLQKSSDL